MRSGSSVFQIPATADFEHVHDPAQNSPIILAPRPRLDIGQMRLDLRPLVIVKPKQMRKNGIPNFRLCFAVDAKRAEFELTFPDPMHQFNAASIG